MTSHIQQSSLNGYRLPSLMILTCSPLQCRAVPQRSRIRRIERRLLALLQSTYRWLFHRLSFEFELVFCNVIFQVVNLSRSELDWVCDHLGHTVDVHRTHYRARSDVIERVEVAKLLMIQDRGVVNQFVGKTLKDIQFSGKLIQFEIGIFRLMKILIEYWQSQHLIASLMKNKQTSTNFFSELRMLSFVCFPSLVQCSMYSGKSTFF